MWWRLKINTGFEIIPAIDVRGGKCVRLYQGDYDKETVFSDDPIDVAQKWVGQGAPRLHIVDLDGAKDGASGNIDIIRAIASSANVPVQVGGGVRSLKTAVDLKSAGVDRVIVGTMALEEPSFVGEICTELGSESVIVGIDARDGYVAVRGWKEQSEVLAEDIANQMMEFGVSRIMYTDIARDGTLTEPNFQAIRELSLNTKQALIAAGGVSTIDHLLRLAELGAEGVVVGKAIYTGDINLAEAIQTVTCRFDLLGK